MPVVLIALVSRFEAVRARVFAGKIIQLLRIQIFEDSARGKPWLVVRVQISGRSGVSWSLGCIILWQKLRDGEPH